MEKIKALGVISGIALISGFIYCIVNQNWSDAFLIAALFFVFHIMPKYLDKINTYKMENNKMKNAMTIVIIIIIMIGCGLMMWEARNW
jgi:hypothetical protein